MAQRKRDASFRALIERFAHDLSGAIVELVQHQVKDAVARASAGRLEQDGRRAGRLCPVPGCGEPGAGPRNRWFCRDHARKLSATEQKSILERNRRLAAEGKLPTVVSAQRIVRIPAKAPRPRRMLDMSCRVEGCPNRSRGPRAGFICDMHRAQISPEEQKEARERWNARHRGAPAPAPEIPRETPVIAPVPPIVRKAEPAAESS
jgi:hypothetical protein